MDGVWLRLAMHSFSYLFGSLCVRKKDSADYSFSLIQLAIVCCIHLIDLLTSLHNIADTE